MCCLHMRPDRDQTRKAGMRPDPGESFHNCLVHGMRLQPLGNPARARKCIFSVSLSAEASPVPRTHSDHNSLVITPNQLSHIGRDS